MRKVLLLAAMLISVPAFAQMDFSGEWAQFRVGEGDPRIQDMGDYFGIPLSAAGRAGADNTNIGAWSLPEYQCRPHPAPFYWRGTGETRITKIVDPVTRDTTAFRVERRRNFDQIVYLDGRPHPPEYAPHTWGGFSTGKYEGNDLVITTTHIKHGYLGMNGMPSSDRTTITERWIRHGDLLVVVQSINDPVYLEEPLVVSGQFRLDLNQQMQITPCIVITESPLPKGTVPHFLPGENSGLTDYAKANGLPVEALKDGAKTMYPEYQFRKSALTLASAGLGSSARDRAGADNEIHVLPVRGNVYMLVGDGANVAVSVGADGALLVDSGAGRKTGKIIDVVKQLLNATVQTSTVKPCLGCAGLASPYFNTITSTPGTAKPIRYVINTTPLADHVDGNLAVVKAGRTITGGDIVLEILGEGARDVAAVLAHENVLIRMSDPDPGKAAPDSAALPSEVYNQDSYRLSQFMNGEGVQIFHAPAAITDGDSMVYFRYSDVIVAGDVLSTTNYPMIDLKKGGSVQGVIDGLNHILDLAVPETRSQGGTMIIPGHGRLCDFGDVAHYRDVVTIIRDRVNNLIKKGMTLQQVKAANLTIDYDSRYSVPDWTGEMFVEAVYNSLKQ